MTTGNAVKKALTGKFVESKVRVKLSAGESLRVLRELQEMTQVQLAAASGIPQSTISGMEKGRIPIGLERAKKLAIALSVHPAVIVFPGWDVRQAMSA